MRHQAATGAVVIFLLCGGGIASAQSPIETLLTGISETPVQDAMGEVIEEICPAGVIDDADLQARCDEMVVNTLNDADNPGTQDGLQAMGPEESTAIQTTQVDVSEATQSGVDVVEARQSGFRTGAGLAGVTLELDGRSLTAASGPGLAAGDRLGGWAFFVNGVFSTGDKDATAREAGFDFDTYEVIAGADYRASDQVILGGAVSYSTTDNDIDAGGGEIDTDAVSVFVYGSYYPSEQAYVDAIIGYTNADHDQVRTVRYDIAAIGGGVTRVDQRALSDTDSEEFFGSLTLGYDFFLDAWTVGPYARVDVAKVDIDGYRERMSNPGAAGSGLALEIDDQDFTSIPAAIGVRITRAIGTGWGALYPEVSVERVHEFENDAEDVTGRFVGDGSDETFFLPTDGTDRNFYNFGARLTALFGEDKVAFIGYQKLLGYSNVDTDTIEAGVRISF